MISGTDEHGTPLLVQAEKEGVSVQELADRYNRQIVQDLAGLGLSYDLFTRTTTRNHYAGGSGAVPRALRKWLHGQADHYGCHFPLHWSHLARPLY